MEEIKPLVRAKYEFEKQDKSIPKHFLENLDYQDSDARIKKTVSLNESSFTSLKFLIETMSFRLRPWWKKWNR